MHACEQIADVHACMGCLFRNNFIIVTAIIILISQNSKQNCHITVIALNIVIIIIYMMQIIIIATVRCSFYSPGKLYHKGHKMNYRGTYKLCHFSEGRSFLGIL